MTSHCTSRVSLGSDNCTDGKCGICSGEEYSADIRFCQNCNKNVCKVCMIMHDTAPCMKVHVLTGAATVKRSSGSSSLPLLRHPCLEHQGHAIEAFCEDHRSLCCSLCVARTHSACVNVVNLAKAAAKASCSPRRKQTISDVKQTRRDLKSTRKARYADKSRLDQERKDVIEVVNDFRRRLSDKLDRMERDFLRNLTAREEHTTASITVDVKACDVMLNELQDTAKDLKDSDPNNEVDAFVNIQKAASRCKEANRMRSRVEEHVNTGHLTFTIEDELEAFLKSFDEFGQFQ